MAAAMQSWLHDEVAELRKELAAARAELHRLRAIDTQGERDLELMYFVNPLFCKRRAQSMSASLRKRPKCCVAAN